MAKAYKSVLTAHPDSHAPNLTVGCKQTLVGSDVLKIEYVMIGEIGDINIPAVELPERHDELWRHTCFEAFVGLDRGYVELNFSPSRHHAAYRFDGYRSGMQPALDLSAPDIYVEQTAARFALTAWIDLKPLLAFIRGNVGLSAVIEAKDGTKSYWALAHAPGPPDFHNPDCFIATLPAPAAP